MILTPKQKAEELVSDFYTINCKLIKVKNGYDMGDRYNLVMPISKKCALKTIDEMQLVMSSVWDALGINENNRSSYLEEVKKEIEKL
jgi:hypothetical protein